jgi:hypothetical protein
MKNRTWTLKKSKTTGERWAVNNSTGETVTEKDNKEQYTAIRKSVISSVNRKAKDSLMTSLGLVKCKGAVTGQTYWE